MKSLCRNCKEINIKKALDLNNKIFPTIHGKIWGYMEHFCECGKYVPSDNLEYLEYKLRQKELKSA